MSKAVIYIRVSTTDQNFDRQEAELKKFASRADVDQVEVIKEKVSGSVPFADRAAAKVLTDDSIKLLIVHDLDRLGRNTIDILTTIKALTLKGTSVVVSKLGIETLLPNGKENPAAKLMFSILATMAEMEREKIRERQKEGIALAKKRGAYKGRKPGTTESREKILSKYPQVQKELRKGTSLRRAAKLCDVSVNTVRKVKEAIA